MDPIIANGSKLGVSLMAPVTMNKDGFAVLAYTSVRGVRSVGDIEQKWETTTHNLANRDYPLVSKSRPGVIELPVELYLLAADPGQRLLLQAFGQDQAVSFRLVTPGLGPVYFAAQVTGRGRGGLAAKSLLIRQMNLVLTAPPIEPL